MFIAFVDILLSKSLCFLFAAAEAYLTVRHALEASPKNRDKVVGLFQLSSL